MPTLIFKTQELLAWMCKQISRYDQPLKRRFILRYSKFKSPKDLDPLLSDLVQMGYILEGPEGGLKLLHKVNYKLIDITPVKKSFEGYVGMTWTTCDLENELASGDKIVELISLNNSLLVIGEKYIEVINGFDGTKSTKKALLSYGIKNFIVARGFYQWIEILQFFSLSETQNIDKVKKETIKLTLLKIMKHLLASLLNF